MLSWRTVIVSCLVTLALLNGEVSAQGEISRIINGMTTTIDQMPYIVELRESSGLHFCGGSLIAPKFVLTAAHCITSRPFRAVRVVGGATNVSNGEGVVRHIVKVHKHPHYSANTFHSDIAVLELNEAMSGPNISTIPLCQRQPVHGDILQVSGWGRTVEEIAKGSPILRTVKVPVMSMDICKSTYDVEHLTKMFCASGVEAKGACTGDSGGPGVINGQLCGLVAFASGCSLVGVPTVFTNVYEMRAYIRDIVGF